MLLKFIAFLPRFDKPWFLCVPLKNFTAYQIIHKDLVLLLLLLLLLLFFLIIFINLLFFFYVCSLLNICIYLAKALCYVVVVVVFY